MAQIPMTPGRGRMPATPALRTGVGMVTPEDFGTREFNEWDKLGRAIQGAGVAHQQWAQHKYNERAEAEARTTLANYMKEMGTLRQQILSTKGTNAFNATKEMEEYSRRKSEDMARGLSTPLAKEMFARSRMDYDRQNAEAASAHVLRQQDAYNQTSIIAESDALLNDAVLNAGDGKVLAGNIQKIKANNARLYAGMPQEFIDIQNRKSAALVAENVASAIAASPEGGPRAALAFLDSGIEAEIGDGALKVKFDALRTDYQKKVFEAEQKAAIDEGIAFSTQAVRMGAEPQDLYLHFVKKFGKETADTIMSGYDKWSGYVESSAKKADEEDQKRRKLAEQRGDDVLTRSAKREGRAQAGKMTNKELRDHAYANFPEKYADILINAWEAEEKSMAVDKANAAIEREEALDKELKSAGYNAAKMPSYKNLPVDEQIKWTKYGNEILGSAGKKSKVDESLYLRIMFDTPVDEVSKMFADPKRRDALVKSLGGLASQQYKDVAALVKEARKGGSGSGGKSDKIKSLDTILNNLKTEAEIVFTDTGRFVGTDAATKATKDDAINRIVSFARHEFEASMKRHQVDDIDALPIDERNRIFSESLVTHEIEEWGRNPIYTRAEAWSLGKELSTVVTASLPVTEREHLYRQGEIRERGGIRFQEDIPLNLLPENIRVAAAQKRATASRNLRDGVYVLTPHDPDQPRVFFSPDAQTMKIEDLAPARADEEDANAAPNDYETMVRRQEGLGGIGLRGRQ